MHEDILWGDFLTELNTTRQAISYSNIYVLLIIKWDPKVQYLIHKRSPLVSILSQKDVDHTSIYYSSKNIDEEIFRKIMIFKFRWNFSGNILRKKIGSRKEDLCS
jgi:hypothetical protein